MPRRASRPDTQNPEWTLEDVQRARPLKDVAPDVMEAVEQARRGRGPQKTPTKELISLRIDRDVVAAFRASGTGWQGRANDALRAYARRRALGVPKAAARKRRTGA